MMSISYYEKDLYTSFRCYNLLVHAAGLETRSSFQNSAAYLNGWLSALKGDKRFIVSAAGKAEKAVELILGQNHAELYN